MKSRKKCNTGGKVNNKVGFQDVAGLASAFVDPISAIPSALNLIGKLAYNPASYTPAKMNESPMGYYSGGDMKQPLSIYPDLDKAMGDHAVEVQGNPGIDTNNRNIGGQEVALTEGEVVRQDPDGSAYVWSNNPSMKHKSGETFAKAMKPIENRIARMKKRAESYDPIATTTLGHLEQIVEQSKNEEEMLRQAKGSPNAQRFNRGGKIYANDDWENLPGVDELSALGTEMQNQLGFLRTSINLPYVKSARPYSKKEYSFSGSKNLIQQADTESNDYNTLITGVSHTPVINNDVTDVMTSSAIEKRFQNPIREGLEALPGALRSRTRLTPQGINKESLAYDKIASPSQRVSNSPFSGTPQNFLKDNPSPLTSITDTGLPQQERFNTVEDSLFLATKGLETLGRVGAALQKPKQYSTKRYSIDRIKYNPQQVLDRNEGNYQGSQFDINTGNANTDRILRNNLYSQKMTADREVMREYDKMQRESDFQTDQYNAQAKANVDNINEQIAARNYQAKDAALSSIGNMASIFQQAGGAKAHNKITMATLNSLSKRYGIDVPNLMLMLEGEGDTKKGVVKYKGDGNG